MNKKFIYLFKINELKLKNKINWIIHKFNILLRDQPIMELKNIKDSISHESEYETEDKEYLLSDSHEEDPYDRDINSSASLTSDESGLLMCFKRAYYHFWSAPIFIRMRMV